MKFAKVVRNVGILIVIGIFCVQVHFVSADSVTPSGMRTLPDPLYGVTVDTVSSVANIVDSSTHLSRMPITRIVFDYGQDASSYASAVHAIQPVSYIMGELADSTDLPRYTLQQYHDRTVQYLATLGAAVDLWEVGNEVNGSWTGAYSDVSAKIYDAWNTLHAAGKRTELTLWYNAGCGNGPAELDPIAFTNHYVPVDMRNGLDYVTISYYETQCSNIRPSAQAFSAFFDQLHVLYPNARLGFGEIGFPASVGSNTAAAQSMINYYYGLHITTPGYVGGYFWWYYYEDMLPYAAKPLWGTLTAAFANMPSGAGSTPAAANGSCTNYYTSSLAAIPPGFAAAYNLFSPAGERVLSVDCTMTPPIFNLGSGLTTQYIYKTGYIYQNSLWQPLALTASSMLISNSWYAANASVELPGTLDLTKWQYVVGYICTWVGGAWKCGCSDMACTTPAWQLQSFKR